MHNLRITLKFFTAALATFGTIAFVLTMSVHATTTMTADPAARPAPQLLLVAQKGPGGYKTRKSRTTRDCNGISKSQCCAGLKSCSCTFPSGYGGQNPTSCSGRK